MQQIQVTLIAALTADGFIGKDAGHTSTQWTSQEDAQHFRQTTKELGVMVMGSTTYKTIGRPLPGRITVVYSRSAPARLEPDKEYPNLFWTSLEPKKLCQVLAEKNYQQLAVCGGSSIYRLFMEAGVVDRLLLTVEPILFGEGIRLFDKAFEKDISLTLGKVYSLSAQTTLFEYKVATK